MIWVLLHMLHVDICSRILCSGEIDCEPPNNRLHKFVGVLTMKDEEEQQPENIWKQYPLDNDKILLRVS